MACVLKLKFQGEVRRIVLPEGVLTYEVVHNGIRQAYPESTVTAKYEDEEKDLCTLCPGSFSDFVEVSGENNGKKVLKLELFVQQDSGVVVSGEPVQQATTNVEGHTDSAPQMAAMIEGLMKGNVNGEHPMAAIMKGIMNGNTDSENPLAEIIKMGMKTFKAFTQQGGGEASAHGCHSLHDAKKLGFAVLQLRNNGELNDNSAAALCAYCLPQVLARVAERPDKINWIAKVHMSKLRPVLEDLRTLIASTEGLKECEAKITNLLEGGEVSASEVLLSLLCALNALPFEAQIVFFKALYTNQEHRLQELSAKMDHFMAWVPTVPLEHHGITCDGCGKREMKGLRFKCKNCPDYDLCSECFCKKGSIHCGEFSSHEFELVHPVSTGMGKGMGKCGKGMGKCGKGEGKGKHRHSAVSSEGVKQKLKPCSREGCSFAATWHPTHCCASCQAGGKHGPRCEKRPLAKPEDEAGAAPQNQQDQTLDEEQAGGESVAVQAQSKTEDQHVDFTFPVVVEDGRRLAIAWNRVDDLEEVAQRFALEHRLPSDELPTITAFLQHVTAMSVSDSEKNAATAATGNEEEKEAVDEALDQSRMQLEAMGFDFGNPEVLLELLKNNDGSVQKVIDFLMAHAK